MKLVYAVVTVLCVGSVIAGYSGCDDEDTVDVQDRNPARTGNILRDGSFEENSASWVYPMKDTGAVIQKAGREESTCAVLRFKAGEYIGSLHQAIPVQKREFGSVTFVGWVKVDGNVVAQVNVGAMDNTSDKRLAPYGVVNNQAVVSKKRNGEWERLELTICVPKEADEVYVNCTAELGKGQKDTGEEISVFFDDFSVVPMK